MCIIIQYFRSRRSDGQGCPQGRFQNHPHSSFRLPSALFCLEGEFLFLIVVVRWVALPCLIFEALYSPVQWNLQNHFGVCHMFHNWDDFISFTSTWHCCCPMVGPPGGVFLSLARLWVVVWGGFLAPTFAFGIDINLFQSLNKCLCPLPSIRVLAVSQTEFLLLTETPLPEKHYCQKHLNQI